MQNQLRTNENSRSEYWPISILWSVFLDDVNNEWMQRCKQVSYHMRMDGCMNYEQIGRDLAQSCLGIANILRCYC